MKNTIRTRAHRVVRLAAVVLAALAASSITAQDLEVTGLEVTQGIQRYKPSDPSHPDNNIVPLVSGNATMVRVYVKSNGFAAGSGELYTARLLVMKEGALPHILTAPSPAYLNVTTRSFRSSAMTTFDFRLPSSLIGYVDIVATLDYDGVIFETDETNNTYTLEDVFFECREAPEIVYLPINYQASAESDPTTIGLPDDARIEPGTGDAFVFGVFPIPDDRGQYHETPGLALKWTADIDNSTTGFLTALEDYRQAIDPPPDILYAWFRGNPYWGNGGTWRDAFVGFGSTDPERDIRTFAHELGHMFGQNHGTCDTYANQYGIDVDELLGRGLVQDDGLYDIMQGGKRTEQAWISRCTYEALYESSKKITCPSTEPSPLLKWCITGKIEQQPLEPPIGTINPFFEYPLIIEPTIWNPTGTCELRILDYLGTPIYQQYFDTYLAGDTDGDVTEQAYALTIPATPGAATFELYYQGQLLAVRDRSPNSPVVSLHALPPILPPLPTISWSASDQDGDPLKFLLRYSPDDGATWVPLGGTTYRTSRTVDMREIAGANGTGRIQVLATDGVNTTISERRGFTVPKKGPLRTYITTPADGHTVHVGAMVSLSSSAYDLEDGILRDVALTWSSDRDGFLGIGQRFETMELSPGSHEITLTASDSDQKEVKRKVNILVAGLGLLQDPLVRGTVVDFQVGGASPGELVILLISLAGPGPGPCLPGLGAPCLDIQSPVNILAVMPVDQTGSTLHSTRIPNGLPPILVSTQAIVLRGLGGELSLKSNVVTDRLQ